MCGQALGYETLALGLFVKLKSNVVRVHRLLSGFRQPCTWSKWASNHLEQKPFFAHILERQWEEVYSLYERTCVCVFVFITLACVCVCFYVQCICVWECVVCATVRSGLSGLQPGPEWLSFCELKHVELSWQRARDGGEKEKEWGRGWWRLREDGDFTLSQKYLPLKAYSALCINLSLPHLTWLSAPVWRNLRHTHTHLLYLWGPS